MRDGNKTKAQLIDELKRARERIAELEASQANHKPVEPDSKFLRNIASLREVDTGDLELADTLDVEAIQSLMNDFYEVAHIPIGIIDLKGKALVGVGWQDICTKFHRVNPQSFRSCIESDIQLSTGVPAGKFKLYKCHNHLWDAATPIILGDRHVGNVFYGQFFFDDEMIDYELFRSQARKYGFPEEEYIAALDAVPRLNRKSLVKTMAFLIKLAQMFSRLSYKNVMLARSLAEQDSLVRSLRAAEEKYRSIFENATVGIFRTTPEGGFIDANPTVSRMFGYTSPEELMNTVRDVRTQLYVDPESRKKWISLVDQQDFATSEVEMQKKDGSTCWVRQSARAVRNIEGQTIHYEGFSYDITEQMRAHEELRKAERKYRDIFENAIEGIYRTTPGGRFLEVNSAFARILGYDSPDSLKSEITDIGQQLYVEPKARREWITSLDQQDYGRFEVQMRRKDGSLCWIRLRARPVRDAGGRTIYFEGFAEDVTERKRIEEELQQYRSHLEKLVKKRTDQLMESENTYRTIFENTGTATLIFGEDTIISLVNTEFERLFLYTKDEVEGKKSWTDLTLPEDWERLMSFHRLRGIDPDAPPRNYELKVVDRTGKVHDAYMTVATIPGTDKRAASLLDITSLKEAERALRESQMHYQALFNHAGVAIAELDAEGKHISFNDSLVDFTGYSREELEGMTGVDITHPDYVEQAITLRSKQVNGEIERFTMEKCYIHKDGTPRWGELRSTPIRDEKGRFLSSVAAITDITERKKAEEALALNEASYRNLFENAPIGMFQATFEDGKFLRVNSAYATMLGYESPKDLMSTLDDAATLHISAEDRDALLNTLKRQDWFYGEYPRFRKDGTSMIGRVAIRRILKPDGRIDYIEGIVEDITERKRAEQALAENEALYRNLFENASIGMFQSSLEGRFLRINKAYATMLGYESTEEVMAAITDTATQIHADPANRAALLRTLEQQEWFYAEQPYLRKDGSVMIGKLAVRKVLKPDGKTAYLEGIVEDITERKRTEEALIKSEGELRIRAQDLMEVNTTLRVLLKAMEKDQEELKERFLENIRAQVLPYFDKLKKRPLQDVERNFIQMAEMHLNEIASPFVQKLSSRYLNLTKKEIQIASLIKEGKTSKEIAGILNSKKRVIDFHRENIRKKLGLNNKKESLVIMLRSLS